MMAISRPVAKRSLDGLLTVVVLVVILASYLGWIVPYRQGFHCDDPDLEYRFTGDSISLGTLLALCLTVPVLFILLTELGRHRPLSAQQITPELRATGVREKRLKTYWRCCLQVYGTYIQGLVCAIAVVEFLKMSVGGLRPHFIDSCKPDFSTINCSQGFVTNYTCTNKDNMPIFRFMDIFKSFPSGHAALSIYMSVFLCFYINKKIVPWPTFLSTAMLQSVLLYWAGYCSVSRILDHRHHWWDVLVGLILGTVCACYSVIKFLLVS